MFRFKKWSYLKTSTQITIIVTLVVIVAAIALSIFLFNRSRAKLIRLVNVSGITTLIDADGKTKNIGLNARFPSGSAIRTGIASSATIALDNTKLVVLDENTTARFVKSDNQFRVDLSSGRLFFNVTEDLADEETFDISTTTMLVGIKGTSGYVQCDPNGNDTIVITTGHVRILGTNPTTGETKEYVIYAGQKITTYLYNDRINDSIVFDASDAAEADIPTFALSYINTNPDLLTEIINQTGWSSTTLQALARGATVIDENNETISSEEMQETTVVTLPPTPTEAPATEATTTTTAEATNTPAPTNTPRPTTSTSSTTRQTESTTAATETAAAAATNTPTPPPRPTNTTTPAQPNTTAPTQTNTTAPTVAPTTAPTVAPTTAPTPSNTPRPVQQEREPDEGEE